VKLNQMPVTPVRINSHESMHAERSGRKHLIYSALLESVSLQAQKTELFNGVTTWTA